MILFIIFYISLFCISFVIGMNLNKFFYKIDFMTTLRNYSKINNLRLKRKRSKIDMDLKSREDPVVMKLDTPEFQNIFTQEVMDLKEIFHKYNYEIRIAGGAVRDLLLGQQAKDLDFATIATPQQMKEMFTEENVRMINMSGEKHGTITPRINDKENFEVTTLRIDMVTDGRHAEVQYTTDWKLDANRRDLTINSMFLGFDGSVYDYFYGYEDLKKRKIAFVGDPDVRIKEDYLRIMRYFRFYGRIAEEADNHDQHTLDVIKQNADGLQNVSGERIWMELKKTLQGNFAGDLLKKILSVNIGQYIGLPNPNIEELDKLLKRSKHLELHPISYLAALLKNIDNVTILHDRLKFSSYDRDLAYFIVENRNCDEDATRPLLIYEKIILNSKIKQKDSIEYVQEVLKYKGEEKLLKDLIEWKIPKFPVNGKILKENGVPPGKMYGRIIQKLKDMWIESEYKLTTEDLIKLIPSVIDEHNK